MCVSASSISFRPFHETVIDALRRCGSPSASNTLNILGLILETEIREGHDDILAAIERYVKFPGGAWAEEVHQVKESLLIQKRAHTPK